MAGLIAALMFTISAGFATVFLFWRQAEANLRTSVEIVGDLVDLATGGEEGLPRAMTLDHLIPTLGRQRKRLLALAASRPDDLPIAKLLWRIESSLAVHLARAGRHEEARAIRRESLARAERFVRRWPSDSAVRAIHRGCLRDLAVADDQLGRVEESVAHLRRAIRLQEEETRLEPSAGRIADLIRRRRDLAWLLYRRGDLGGAEPLVVANRRSLADLPAGRDDPPLSVLRLVCRIDELELLSGELGLAGPSACLASPADASRSPEEWAQEAARALRSADRDPRAAARRESVDTLGFMGYLACIGSAMRRSGNVERAGRVAERMLALGRRVVAAHPEEPDAHLALSQAYGQVYKIGYEYGDMATVRSNMTMALDAAREALLRDLGSEEARHAVDDLERRLANL